MTYNLFSNFQQYNKVQWKEQVIKDLKVKGAGTLKRGTTFNNIRLIDGDDGNIEAGAGRNTVVLKTMFLKKVV